MMTFRNSHTRDTIAALRELGVLQNVRALSVRQPYANQIMLGSKQAEYRSWRTLIRGRVLIYASKGGDHVPPAGGECVKGAIIGSVEIVGCARMGRDLELELDLGDSYAWQLERPIWLPEPVKPDRHPQPAFFYPFNS